MSTAAISHAAKPKAQVFSVESQPMPLALMILARQAEVEILFSYDELKGFQAPKVAGRLTLDQALAAMLKGTPYTVDHHPLRARTFRIMSPQMLARAATEDKRPTVKLVDRPPEPIDRPPPVLPVGDASIDRAHKPDDVAPYVVFDGNTVEQSGAQTVGDFLSERLPSASGSNLAGDIGMRAMSSRYTRVLVNGREQPDVTGAPNSTPGMNYRSSPLALLPLSSIDRIEVIPQSAGVAAGGGLIGGAVNVVTKRDYTGGEITFGYDNSFNSDSSNKKVELRYGASFNDNRTRLMVFAGAVNSNSLAVQDRYDLVRDYMARATTQTPGLLNGTEILFGTTSRVDSADGSPLVLKTGDTLSSSFLFMPAGYRSLEEDGPAPLIANAGKLDPDSPDTAQAYLGRRMLLNRRPDTQVLQTEIRHALSSYAEAYLDLSYRRSERSQEIGVLSSDQYVTVPAGVPNNPFGQAVRVRFPYAINGSHRSKREHQTFTAGALLSLPKEWKARVEHTYSLHRSVDKAETASSSSFQTAILDGTINVFSPSIIESDLLGKYITARTGRGNVEEKTTLARAEGALPSLLSVQPRVNVGFQAREVKRDTFRVTDGTTVSGILPTTFSSWGFFGELTVPFFTEERNLPGVSLLELTISGRSEKHGVDSTVVKASGSQTVSSFTSNLALEKYKSTYVTENPVVGLRYQPVADLTLRASFSTGFVPTEDFNLLPQLTAKGNITDPLRGDSTYETSITTGGNSDLSPEHADTLSAGVVYSPKAVPGFRISVDYTDSRREGLIDILDTRTLLAYESAIPGRIKRDPLGDGDTFSVGKISSINATAVSLYSANLKAWDVSIAYKKDLPSLGAFDFSALYTLNSTYEQQLVPGGRFVDLVSAPLYAGPFRDKASASVTWTKGPLSAGWAVRFHSRYKGLATSSPEATQLPDINPLAMSARTYHDAFVRYRFSTQARGVIGFLDRTELLFGVRNLFGADPLFDASLPADLFLSGNGELRRQSYYLSLKREF